MEETRIPYRSHCGRSLIESYRSSTGATAALMIKDLTFCPSMETRKTASLGVLLGFLWVLIMCSFHSRWKSIHGRSPVYHRAHTLHRNQRQFSTNLCDVDGWKTETPEEAPTHFSKNKSMPGVKTDLARLQRRPWCWRLLTASLVIYHIVSSANVNECMQSDAWAFISTISISESCAHMS